MGVRLLITGGTIDKVYDQSNGELTFEATHFPEMLLRARTEVEITSEILLLKDSLDMIDSDRALILKHCLECEENRILITHGTDTMCETAKLLGEGDFNKTIVLFGAMVPYAVNNSDALFNFGCALGSVQLLDPGVYVAMNGRVLPWGDVQKNRDLGVFQPLSP
ncbi:MAG TPA: asparaginase [Candidatus Thioglobus sp.]|jgi:L-asparaginase|nr:asparaginase [Candidatus Thioglobus sp.]HIL20082.1 asparaginase [Candidatus Thioglobus sp.]